MNASITASIPIGEEEDEIRAIRESVSTLCSHFPGEYWREKDREQAYPAEFVKVVNYANDRTVFGRPIGKNQGIQFPIAKAYAATEAADMMVERAARIFDAGNSIGPEANMAKYLAAEASWMAADMCMQTHGGFGFYEEFDIERKFRETRLYQVAQISTNLVLAYLAEHVLGLPRTY